MGAVAGDASGLDLSKLVTIVGAGFSKHASPSMPVLTELGDALVARLRGHPAVDRLTTSERALVDSDRVPLGDLEAWLTSLATAQPYNTRPEQLRRRALFLDVAAIAGEIVAERERESLRAPVPHWLARLVTLWHYRRSTVLTFNYDTLIEATAETLSLIDAEVSAQNRLGGVTTRNLTRGFPPSLPGPGMEFAPVDVETLELVKLHGSLNWWGRSSANDLFSIVAGGAASSWETDAAHKCPMRGLSQVIVPPIADKSGQYGNSTIETLWLTAAQAIREASTIMLFGYSLPPSDTTATALLSENAPAQTPILVVDPCQQSIVERMREWLPNDIEGLGCENLDNHTIQVDRLLEGFERAAVSGPIPWHEGDAGGQLNPNCFVHIHTANGLKLDCSGLDADTHVLLAGGQAVSSGSVRPSGKAVDPNDLARCRFVRTEDGQQLPVYRFDRHQNTTEHSVVRVRAGPLAPVAS